MANKQSNDDGFEHVPQFEEERGLLSSFSGDASSGNPSNNNSTSLLQNHSMVDQPIAVESSDAGSEKHLYQAVRSNSSSVSSQQAKPTKVELQVNQQKQFYKKSPLEDSASESKSLSEPDTVFEQIISKVKSGWAKFVQMVIFKRDYESFGQLYTQILFDGAAVYYFYRKKISLMAQRSQSFEDEGMVRECMAKLSLNPMCFYEKAPIGRKVLVFGHVNSSVASNFLSRKASAKSVSEQKNQKEILDIQIKTPSNGEISAFLDQSTVVRKLSALENPSNSQKFLTKVTSALLSITSLNLFKTKVQFEPSSRFINVSHYFFGQKIQKSSGKGDLLAVTQVFKEFDLQQFSVEQKAFLLSAIVASGVGIYFAVKFIKNIHYLLRKKKLYKALSK